VKLAIGLLKGIESDKKEKRGNVSNTGKITKINSELGYGFVQVAKIGDVFFSSETRFSGTTFESLKVHDSVQLSVIETERGPFAESLSLAAPKRRERIPEVGV
jgi:cold shock CspA family protein